MSFQKKHVYKISIKYWFFSPCVLRDEWGTGGFGWGKKGEDYKQEIVMTLYTNVLYKGAGYEQEHVLTLFTNVPCVLMNSHFVIN